MKKLKLIILIALLTACGKDNTCSITEPIPPKIPKIPLESLLKISGSLEESNTKIESEEIVPEIVIEPSGSGTVTIY